MLCFPPFLKLCEANVIKNGKKMKRFCSFMLLLLAWAIPSVAEQALVVHLTDGQQAVFVLSGSPVLTTDGSEVTVTTTTGEKVAYALSGLDRFTLEDVDVDAVEAVSSRTLYRSTAEGLQASGLQAGEAVRIYDVNGRLVVTQKAGTDGSVSLPLRRGLYVVKTSSQTFKFMKR